MLNYDKKVYHDVVQAYINIVKTPIPIDIIPISSKLSSEIDLSEYCLLLILFVLVSLSIIFLLSR